jgi:hypothetical protein
MFARRQKAEAAMVQLQQTNPALAAQIAEMSPIESFLVGTGRGFTDIGRGIGLVDEAGATEEAAFQALADQSQAAGAGQILGQAAPFIPLGLGAGALASTPARIAASSAVGGLEGGTIAAGTGGDVVEGALIGAAIGGGAEAALPLLNRGGRSIAKKLGLSGAGKGDVAAVSAALDQSGINPDDFIAATNEIQKGGDIVGNAEREAVFRKLGLEPTEAQRTRDIDLFVDQQDAFRKSGKVRDALDLQETQLTEATARVVSDIGATQDPKSAIDAITDRSIRLDDEIGQLYTEARSRAGTKSNVRVSNAIESLRINAPRNTRSEGTVQAIRDQMQIMGVVDDKFKPVGRINVEQAEELRQFSNSLFEGSNQQAKTVIREFKEGLDKDVFKAAGDDVFQAARAAKSNFEKGLTKEAKNKFDRNKTSLVRDMLDNTLAPEDAGKIVRAGSKYKAADLMDLKRYLSSGSAEDIAVGTSAWNDIRGSAMEIIKDTAFIGPERQDGTKTLLRAGLERAFKTIGNDKLRVLFDKKERDFLRDLASVAALKEAPPGTFTGTGPTGLAVKRLGDRLLQNSGVPGAAVAADVVGGFTGGLKSRAQEKRVLKLVSDAEKLQKINAKKAFESLRKSQLGQAASVLPLAGIAATQEDN